MIPLGEINGSEPSRKGKHMAENILADRYEIQQEIGRGGMATVYRGRDRTLDRPVAVKVIRPDLAQDATFRERFRREAGAAAGLSHQHIVSIYDAHLSEPPYYMVCEYVSGGSLQDRLAGSGALPVAEALSLAGKVCAALGQAHAQGLIHRDVKPSNILLTGSGEPKLADFGIAQARTAPKLTEAGMAPGTAHYASPEQVQGKELDPRSDLYSLGVVLYEMLAGQVPFEAETPVSIGLKHLTEPLPSLRPFRPEIPAAVEAVVRKALTKEPEGRYASAAEMQAALEKAHRASEKTAVLPALEPAGEPTAVLPPAPPAPAPAQYRHQRPPLRIGRYLAGLIALGLLGGLLYAFIIRPLQGDILVPEVVGKTEFQAKRALQELSLKMVVEERREDAMVPGGKVISQNPPAKFLGNLLRSRLNEDDTVRVVLSKGPRYVIVPNLKGLKPDQARNVLVNGGLSLGRQEEAYDPYRPEGTILAQDPTAGNSVEKGRGVIIYVNQQGAEEIPEEITDEKAPEDASATEEEGFTDRLREQAQEKAGALVDEAVEGVKEKAAEKVEEAKEKAREGVREKVDDLKESLPWNRPKETEGSG